MKTLLELLKSEKDVRQLRANIYGECTDESWKQIKHNWMRPDSIRFLLDYQPDQIPLRIEEAKKYLR